VKAHAPIQTKHRPNGEPAGAQELRTSRLAGLLLVGLSGHHSNPPAPLEALLEGVSSYRNARFEAAEDRRARAPVTAGTGLDAAHPRQGRIIDAIARVLVDARDPMRVHHASSRGRRGSLRRTRALVVRQGNTRRQPHRPGHQIPTLSSETLHGPFCAQASVSHLRRADARFAKRPRATSIPVLATCGIPGASS